MAIIFKQDCTIMEIEQHFYRCKIVFRGIYSFKKHFKDDFLV